MSKKLLTPALLCLLLSGIMISAVAEESVVLVLAGEVDVDLCFEEDIYEEAGIAELWVGEFDVWADTPNSAVQITIAHFGDADAVYSLDTIAAAMNDAMAMYGIDTYEIVYDYDGGTASAMRTVNVIQCGDLAEGEDLVDPEEGEDLVDPEEGEDAVDPEEGEGAVDPEEGEGAVDPEEGEGAVDPEEGEGAVDPVEGEEDTGAGAGCNGLAITLGSVLLGGLTLLALWIGSMLLGGPVWPPVNV